MTPSHSKPKPPYRGTIIVDANVLYTLLCPVKGEYGNKQYPEDKKSYTAFSAKRIKDYLGILEFLAKNGFRVVIPELIAAEAGSVLECGTSMMDYAGIRPEERPTFFDTKLVKLLQKVAQDRYPNIVIVSAHRPANPNSKNAARYIEKLRGVKRFPPGTEEAKTELNQIKGLMRQNFGEQAILGFIADTSQSGLNDVFVLSDDSEALANITQQCHVPVINTKALLTEFIGAGLHKAVGLKHELKAKQILQHCADRRTEITGIQQFPVKKFIDYKVRNEHGASIPGLFKDKMRQFARDVGLLTWQQRIENSEDFRDLEGDVWIGP